MSNTEQTQTAGELEVQSQATAVGAASRSAARWAPDQVEAANLDTAQSLPSLENATAHPAPLSIAYWSPTEAGESKSVFVFGVADAEIQDMETKEPKTAECVFLLEQTADNQLLRWYSASKILVGSIKSAIDRGEILPGTYLTPVRITYKGLKRTKSGKNAANWEILRLIISVQE